MSAILRPFSGLGMAGELFSSTVVIFAVLAFYSLFKAVSGKHARAMLVLMLISVPISYLNVLTILPRSRTVLSSFPSSINLSVTPSSCSSSALHSQGFILAQIFWDSGCFPSASWIMRPVLSPSLPGHQRDRGRLRVCDQFVCHPVSPQICPHHWSVRDDSRNGRIATCLDVDLGCKGSLLPGHPRFTPAIA